MKPLKPFSRIEQSLETMIEGAINRVFRPSVQPSEIARKLAREMSEKRLVSVRGTIVPNAFVVGLSTQDFETFAGSEALISGHLEDWLESEAERLGFHPLGPMAVRLVAEEQAKARSVRIESAIDEGEATERRTIEPAGHTEALVLHRPPVVRQHWIIEISSGPLAGIAHWIDKRETTIGRALDNDFVIDAPNISRHHAIIEVQGNGLKVGDLGSLNGTFVNQRPVQGWAAVNPGDTLTFGLVHTRVFVDFR